MGGWAQGFDPAGVLGVPETLPVGTVVTLYFKDGSTAQFQKIQCDRHISLGMEWKSQEFAKPTP